MDWKRKFGRTILERGRDYYLAGNVWEITYDNLVYKGKVAGTGIYQVEIKIRNDDIVYMMCS